MDEETLRSEGEAPQAMQESWVEVAQQPPAEEGTLVHSHSQEEVEQMLAEAASGGELSDTDLLSSPSLQFTAPPQRQQVSETTQVETEHLTAQRLGSVSQARASLSLRGSGLFGGDVLQLLFPVLILTHLAFFGLGFYIGRRMALVRPV